MGPPSKATRRHRHNCSDKEGRAIDLLGRMLMKVNRRETQVFVKVFVVDLLQILEIVEIKYKLSSPKTNYIL